MHVLLHWLGLLHGWMRRLFRQQQAAYGSAILLIDYACKEFCLLSQRVIAEKRILIATGGSATAEMAMKYSSFSLWLSKLWLAFMDESQQHGNYHEIAALAAIQQPALLVFVGDHRQTPGGPSKRRAAANRQKLLHLWGYEL